MRASVEPNETPDADDTPRWLESLASGQCTPDEFLREVISREQRDPELMWEVLSLLDQYFRRKRITHDVFVSVKARLHKHSLGVAASSAPPVGAAARQSESQIIVPLDVAPRSGRLEPTLKAAPTASPPAPQPPLKQIPVKAAPVDGFPGVRLCVGCLIRERFRVVSLLRQDAQSTLIEAVDEHGTGGPNGRQRVAIEVFSAGRSQDPTLLHHLHQLQALSHPCIERIFDVDEQGGEVFVTREWQTGSSLEQMMGLSGGARLSVPAALGILRWLASALSYAHSHGIFHGDVRAGTVFVTELGEVRLRGFEVRGREWQGNAAADRLAFAWLAYELLSGRCAPHDGAQARDSLSRPPGLTREQWKVLRDTLVGRESRKGGNVLAAFAGAEDFGANRFSLLHAFAPGPQRSSLRPLLAASVVVAVLGVVGYLIADPDELVTPRTEAIQQTPAAQPVAASKISPARPQVAASQAGTEPVFERARIDIPSTSTEVDDDQPFARIWVRRRDKMTGPVSFRWWTETGSAQNNEDFLGIEPRTETIADGARGIELHVPLLANPARQQPRTFFVKIDQPGHGATLGAHTLMQVTINPAQQPPLAAN